MNITTTLSRYDQKDASVSEAWEDTHPMDDTSIQITQVVSCVVRLQDEPVLQSREAREKLIRDHIERAG